MSEICEHLHRLFQQLPTFGFPFDSSKLPRNGIYILYESGELAHETDRIVRIGTHTGDNRLPSRLKEHFLKENKDRSIFRKNIGRAILNRANEPFFLAQWNIDLTTRQAKVTHSGKIDHARQKAVENQVTNYIQRKFRLVVFRVDDKDKRLSLESAIISAVSLCDKCQPSDNWLGLHSPIEKVRQSGLWLVNRLYKTPLSNREFGELRRLVIS
jgi:hypothetical protein